MQDCRSRVIRADSKLSLMGMNVQDSPVSFLLDRIAINRGQEKAVAICLGTVLAVCSLLAAFFSDGLAAVELFRRMLPVCYWFYALWALWFFPMSICWYYASLHQSLLLKERYQDLLGSSLTPRLLVDQIAYFTIRKCFLETLKPMARLGCALALCHILGKTQSLDAFLWSLRYSLYLLGGSAVFLLPVTYLCQHWSVLMHFQRNLTSICQVVGLFGLCVFGFGLSESSHPWLSLFVGWVVAVVAFRYLAIWVAQEVPRLQQLGGSQRRLMRFRNNHWILSWSENPVIFRERARQSRQVPFGPLGAVVFDLPMVSFFGLMVVAIGISGSSYDNLWIFGVPLGIVQTMRAARSSSLAAVSEVVHRTLEATSLTSLTAAVFQRGWLELVAVPLLIENILVIVCLGGFGLACHGWNELTTIGLNFTVLLLLLGPLFGAIIGFYVSCAANLELQKTKASNVSGSLIGLFFGSAITMAVQPALGLCAFCAGLLLATFYCFRGGRQFLEGNSR
jgi:hypothetical protein